MLSIPINRSLPRIPRLVTSLPGPRARALVDRDRAVTSPSYTRGYPLVAARGEGCMLEDVDGNVFLDLTAGIAVTNTGHAHPEVVRAIQAQSAHLIHMSDTELRDKIVNSAFYKGLLLLGCGKAAIRFCPPLVIDRDQIQVALQILAELLEALSF